MPTPRVLSIAGSDSGGGAGIQADLKAFAACGAHGLTAITAITAQNTVAVTAVHHIPGELIVAQVRAVVQDIGVDAVKIGMLGRTETIEAVAEALELLDPDIPVVLDPVMVSESGAQLLEADARGALTARLFGRATVLTPNLPEARAIVAVGTGTSAPRDDLDPVGLVQAIRALGPDVVVLTGGHRREAVDLFYDGREYVEIAGPRHPDGAAHGSGCTHSSLLAARLAWGDDALSAARTAKRMVSQAIADGLRDIGRGAGPVNVLAQALEFGEPAAQDVRKPTEWPQRPA
jgi:hydroxymethylpyrimidine/phosphomethylpyrimidine kinase